jgi:N-acyl-D-amino-acid deacylase
MKALFEAELRAGAFGLSSGLEYEPDSYATTEEVVELAKAVRRFGGFYVSHVRDEGARVIESFRELVEIARRAGVPAQIGHVKLGAVSAWGRMPEYRALVREADASGLRITADCYPYDYWHSTLRVLVLSRRYDDYAEVKRGVDDNGGPKNRKPESGGAVESILGTSMREEDIRDFYRDPRVMVSSDGAINGSHPRGAGAFPRFLGRYVREAKVVSLEEGVRRMTALPASVLGLRDRGRIAPGMKADLVVFDPASVVDRSTVADPGAAPDGIPFVVVNGELVVDVGWVTPARPGRVLSATAR